MPMVAPSTPPPRSGPPTAADLGAAVAELVAVLATTDAARLHGALAAYAVLRCRAEAAGIEPGAVAVPDAVWNAVPADLRFIVLDAGARSMFQTMTANLWGGE